MKVTLHSSPSKAIRHGSGQGQEQTQENSGSLFSWVGPLPDCGVLSSHFMEENQLPEAETTDLKLHVFYIEVRDRK